MKSRKNRKSGKSRKRRKVGKVEKGLNGCKWLQMVKNGRKWLKMAENGSEMPQQYTVGGRQQTIELTPKQKFHQKLKCHQN